MRFTGKSVLVTGAGSGLGRAAALAFAREGAAVTAAGRTAARLRETVELVAAEGGKAQAVAADVTVAQDVERLVGAAAAWGGGLHVALNSAGILTPPGTVVDTEPADWDRLLLTNTTGVFLSMKYEIAWMREHGGGTVVNVSSQIGAHLRLPGLGAYAASKAAVTALSRTAARDHAGEGVRVNVLSPGPLDTPMSLRPGESEQDRAARMRTGLPAGRVGDLAEAVSAALWLASDEAGFAVGTDLVLDGGAAA